MTSTSDPTAAFTAELARLGDRLDRVEARLQLLGAPHVGADGVTAVLERPGAVPPPVAAEPGPAGQGPAGQGPAGPRPWWAAPPADAGHPGPDPALAAPGQAGWAAPGQAGPGQPTGWAPAPPWVQAPGLPSGWAPSGPAPTGVPAPRATAGGARLLAWTGAAMTLLGVVLFLALAASRGWGTPAVRVGAGTVLGVVLVAIAVRLHRTETRRAGAMALAGTGFGALYLVVAAANRLLDLPGPPAVLLALVVAGAGLALSDRWRSALLAGGIVVGGAWLAPVLAEGPLLVALLLALQAVTAAVSLRRGWAWPAVLAAVGPALAASAVAVSDDPLRAVAVVAVTLLGLAGAALAVRRLPEQAVVALVALAPLPMLVLAPALDGWGGAGVAAAAALLVLTLSAVPGVGARLRTAIAAVGAVGVLEAVLIGLDGPVATGALLVVAIALSVVAVAVRDRLPLRVSGGFWLVGTVLALAADAPLLALVDFPADPYVVDGTAQPGALVAGAVVSLLVLLASAAITVAAGRLGVVRPDSGTAGIWVPLGVAGLYGTAGLIVSLALLVAPDRTAFTVGHAVVTVSWTVVALVLLARGLRRPALRATGLVLVAGAVAKLVLFDLVVLDGLVQVAAFLGAGLVLLAAGTRYARMVAEAQ